ncbi:MAG: Ig-like domain-containing protein, partial [Elusimicrobia bacterium]|nr:Ig-like domain-containing protein [Elusimicrobiota bacterium]
ATGAWTAGPALTLGRRQHEAVRLADGRVLVAGGHDPTGAITNAVEIYDPALSTWTAAAPMSSGRVAHTLALLSDGRVLAAGGWNGSSLLSGAEIYDPAANAWTAAAAMSVVRIFSAVATLGDGKILVVGGSNGDSAIATAEAYDPATGAWTPAGTMGAARYYHRAALLPDGKVLTAGGNGPAGPTATADVYDPATNAWTATGAMGAPRYAHALVPVGGKALSIGGENASGNLASTEIYDASTNAWLPGPSLLATRSWLQAGVLDDGRVLAAGGRRIEGGATHLNTAELLGAAAVQIAATGVAVTDAQHLTGTLDLTGAATGYWNVVVRETGGRIGRLDGGFQVTPGAPTLASIAVTPATASIAAGTTAQFTAEGTFTDASTRTLTSGEVAWTTDVSSVATVNAGLATGAAAGTARVIASSGAITGYATLTVTPPPVTLASIAVTPATATLLAGATEQFSAVGTFTDGSTRALTTGGAWQVKSPMNAARYAAPGEFAAGKFFVFGGYSGSALTSTEAYDPLTDAWTARAQPVDWTYAQAAAAGGKISVAGGCVNADCASVTNALWMYDPAADAWTLKASMPTARFQLAFEAIDGKLYAAGGL